MVACLLVGQEQGWLTGVSDPPGQRLGEEVIQVGGATIDAGGGVRALNDRASDIVIGVLVTLAWVYVIYRWRTDLHPSIGEIRKGRR